MTDTFFPAEAAEPAVRPSLTVPEAPAQAPSANEYEASLVPQPVPAYGGAGTEALCVSEGSTYLKIAKLQAADKDNLEQEGRATKSNLPVIVAPDSHTAGTAHQDQLEAVLQTYWGHPDRKANYLNEWSSKIKAGLKNQRASV